MFSLPSKLPQVGTSIFAIMSALSLEHGAINLSQGFPDFDCPPFLIEQVYHFMKKGFNQYAPMPGILPLRKKLSKKIQKLYGYEYNPETEITLTSGATEALYGAITATVRPGTEVILFTPCYDSYEPAIFMNGGIPKYIHLSPPHYQIPWAEVQKAITPNTHTILLNTPHNPTGSIWKKEDMEALSRLVEGKEIAIISDEVYEHITFDGNHHESIILYPELRKRGLAIFSFGKTFHTTGWKMGYAVAPEPLSKELRKVHQFITFSSSAPFQYAFSEFLDQEEFYLSLPSFFEKKRDSFLSTIQNSLFKPLPCQGTYFQLLDYSAITSEKDTEYAIRLTREQGVASIPISVFYPDLQDHKVLRFCFAKKEETLEEAGKRLCRI